MSAEHQPQDEPSDAAAADASSGEVGQASDLPDEEAARVAEIVALNQTIEQQKAELLEVRKQYHAAMEEFENSKARIERQAARDVAKKTGDVLGEFLGAADNLDRALAAAEAGQEGLLDGVKLVQRDFMGTLSKFGVKPIEAMGKPFDPTLHDAVSFVPVQDPAQHKVVVGEVKKGYLLGDQPLRAATVAVGNHAGSQAAEASHADPSTEEKSDT